MWVTSELNKSVNLTHFLLLFRYWCECPKVLKLDCLVPLLAAFLFGLWSTVKTIMVWSFILYVLPHLFKVIFAFHVIARAFKKDAYIMELLHLKEGKFD